MKTIRNQVDYPNKLQRQMLLQKGIKTCPYSVLRGWKEQQQKNKNSINTC